jgi:hypothetical protein
MEFIKYVEYNLLHNTIKKTPTSWREKSADRVHWGLRRRTQVIAGIHLSIYHKIEYL